MPRIKVKKQYSKYNPLFVYTEDYHQLSLEEIIEREKDRLYEWELRQHGVKCHYATKEIYGGEMLEVKVYPCFLGRTDFSKAKNIERSSKKQKNLNDRYARENLVRQVNTNFSAGDYALVSGYRNNNQPKSISECKRDISNFIRTIKRWMKKAGEDPSSLKYLYIIETKEKSTGTHYHIHFLFSENAGSNNKGVDNRDFLESLWTKGPYPQTRRLVITETGGLTGISTYITEQFEEFGETEPNRRRWGSSQGLKKFDKKRKTFRKFSKRKVYDAVKAPRTLGSLFEKEYPEYRCNPDYPAELKYNKEIDGYYIYCRMYKRRE